MCGKTSRNIFKLLCITILLVGCGSAAQKEATEAAVTAAQSAIAGVQGDAGKYVSQAMGENSVSGLLIAAAVGGVLGYLLHRSS